MQQQQTTSQTSDATTTVQQQQTTSQPSDAITTEQQQQTTSQASDAITTVQQQQTTSQPSDVTAVPQQHQTSESSDAITVHQWTTTEMSDTTHEGNNDFSRKCHWCLMCISLDIYFLCELNVNHLHLNSRSHIALSLTMSALLVEPSDDPGFVFLKTALFSVFQTRSSTLKQTSTKTRTN